MLRRSHKKSKDGCRECKRRHVKCDEARPCCRLCVLSERTCTYATPGPPVPAPDHSPAASTPSNGTSRSATDSPLDAGVSANAQPPRRPNIPGELAARGSDGQPPETDQSSFSGEINIDHAELLMHLYKQFQERELFVLADRVDDHQWAMNTAFDIARGHPFLLYELLAFTACHLSHLHPLVSKYRHLAVNLQSQAVTLFNASGTEITPDNCVAMLIFSTIIGQHLFADVLRPRDLSGLGPFIERFTHCLALQKGISVIFLTARPVLMASPIERVLTAGLEAQRQEPVGDDCAQLTDLIRDSARLSPAEREACIHATWILQLGFDDMAKAPGETTHLCYKLVVAMRPELRVLLEKMQPEGLIFLAYYALLLHMNRRAWPIGSAGAYMLGMIIGYLGEEWEPWLAYPRRRMSEES